MKRKNFRGTVLLLLLGSGAMPAGAQKVPPMEATVVYKGFKDGELVRVQTGAQIPVYTIVRHFYDRAFTALVGGEATFHELLQHLDIQPGSEPAKALAKAALQAEALRYDGEDETKLLHDEEAYYEAQRRTLQADKEALVRIHAEFLRRLEEASYPREKLEDYLEEVRRSSKSTIYGGKPGEPNMYYTIVFNFAQEVRDELAKGTEEETP